MSSLFTSINRTSQSSKRVTLESLVKYINENIINMKTTVDTNSANSMNNYDIDNNDNNDTDADNDSDSESMFAPLRQNMIKLISVLPLNLQNLLDTFLPDITRIGVMENSINNKYDIKNISLFTSILSCLKDDFILQPSKNETNLCQSIK